MREKKREINRGKEREVDGWRQGKKKEKEKNKLRAKILLPLGCARSAIFGGKRTRD